jgi:hypothetical protein
MDYELDKWPCDSPLALLQPNEYDPYGVVSSVNAVAEAQVCHPSAFSQTIAGASDTNAVS